MTSDTTTKKSRRSGLVKTIRVVAALLALAALVKELRTPAEERTWHGALGGFIPYDFRMPTMERIKSTLWDPDGSIIVGRVFGLGWTINLGAVVERARSLRAAA